MPRLTPGDAAERARRELDGANPADFSEALARGLSVLQAFSVDNPRLTQADLARRLNLPRPTVRRAVVTLVHLGFLEQEGRTYQLSSRVLNLATAFLTSNSVSLVVQPVCEQLCAEFNASCTAAVVEDRDAVMIARALPRDSLSVGAGIGFRVPAATSALGRVLLAEYDTERRAPFLAATDDPTRLSRILEQVREEGYAYVANEVETGYHSVAVPLRRWDWKIVAALNVGTNIDRIPPDHMTGPVLTRLRETATTLRRQLV